MIIEKAPIGVSKDEILKVAEKNQNAYLNKQNTSQNTSQNNNQNAGDCQKDNQDLTKNPNNTCNFNFNNIEKAISDVKKIKLALEGNPLALIELMSGDEKMKDAVKIMKLLPAVLNLMGNENDKKDDFFRNNPENNANILNHQSVDEQKITFDLRENKSKSANFTINQNYNSANPTKKTFFNQNFEGKNGSYANNSNKEQVIQKNGSTNRKILKKDDNYSINKTNRSRYYNGKTDGKYYQHINNQNSRDKECYQNVNSNKIDKKFYQNRNANSINTTKNPQYSNVDGKINENAQSNRQAYQENGNLLANFENLSKTLNGLFNNNAGSTDLRKLLEVTNQNAPCYTQQSNQNAPCCAQQSNQNKPLNKDSLSEFLSKQ